MFKREKIVIVGGGQTGINTALILAGLQFPGKANADRYNVTILESRNKLNKGASEAAYRLHYGGEYPLDSKTAIDCLWNAVAWKSLYGDNDIFTDEESMRFLISKTTQEMGKNGDPKSITLEKYEKHYELLKAEYTKIINILHSKNLGIKALSKDVIAHGLFGDPENLYERQIEEELKSYGGNIAGGFRTKEPGFHIHRLHAIQEHALGNCKNIDIKTSQHVNKIEPAKGGGYNIYCESGEVIFADQVVQAAGDGGIRLDGPLRRDDQHKKVIVYRRVIAIVDTSMIPVKLLPGPSFTFKDGFGGMFCPINKDYAAVYHPEEGNISEAVMLDSRIPEKRNIPESWRKKLSDEEKIPILDRHKNRLAGTPENPGIYPFLRKAKFVDLIEQLTLNFQNTRDERRHEHAEEIRPGYNVLYSTKVTNAVQVALEAVHMIRQRSEINHNLRNNIKLNKIDSDKLLTPPKREKILMSIMKDIDFDIKASLKISEEQIAEYLRMQGTSESAGTYKYAEKRKAYNISETAEPTTLTTIESTANTKKAQERMFGLGFGGPSIVVYTKNAPRTGNLFHHEDDINLRYCQEVNNWLASETKEPLTDTFTRANLDLYPFVHALQNCLMYNDKLPDVTEHLVTNWAGEYEWKLLFGKENIKRFPQEIWNNVSSSRKFMLPTWSELQNTDKIDVFFKNHTQIVAAILPTVFSTLPEDYKLTATIKLTENLSTIANNTDHKGIDRNFFRTLADPNVNRAQLHSSGNIMMAKDIEIHAGRSIKINHLDAKKLDKADLTQMDYIEFQGRKYYPVEFHFHRTKNVIHDAEGQPVLASNVKNNLGEADGNLEYKIYSTPEKEKFYLRNKLKDPNNNSVGELHAIYIHVDQKTGYHKGLALCSHVKLGEKNIVLSNYTDKLDELNKPLRTGKKLKLEGVPFNPLGCFFTNFDMDGIYETGFASLSNQDKDVFYNGVDILMLGHKNALEISIEQLQTLQKQLPVLSAIGKDVIFPVAKTGASL